MGSIIGLPVAFILAYAIPFFDGEGIMWHLARTDIVAVSPFAPYIIATLFGIFTAFIGLIAIKFINSVSKFLNKNNKG